MTSHGPTPMGLNKVMEIFLPNVSIVLLDTHMDTMGFSTHTRELARTITSSLFGIIVEFVAFKRVQEGWLAPRVLVDGE